MKTVFVLLFALLAVAHSFEYIVDVKLGNRAFDTMEDSSLKLIINGETYRIKKS